MRCLTVLVALAAISWSTHAYAGCANDGDPGCPPMAVKAAAPNMLPPTWQMCEKSDDCMYVRNETSCATLAVNKKYADQANTFISKPDGDNRQMGIGGGKHCLNQPEATCTNRTCVLVIHPE